MTKQEVIDLMRSSKTEDEWNDNCNKVKKACNGYPDFWFEAIVMSGLAKEVLATFGATDAIVIKPMRRPLG